MKLISEIEGFEKFTGYGITSCGRVWSFKRDKFLKPYRDKDGYLRVCLTDGKKSRKTVGIHQLVALAYIPNPDSLETVDHLDSNKEHNYINNLQWMSRKENSRKAQNKPVKCVETGQIFESGIIAAKEMGLNQCNVSAVCCGKYNQTGGYHFEFI